MAKKNSRKVYAKDSFYHIYNRGVEKRKIFECDQDYKVFLGYLKKYLSPPPNSQEISLHNALQDPVLLANPRPTKNYHKEIDLLAFCLMPNHFHLLIKQNDETSIKEFLHSLTLRYSMYFNKAYDRVGPLFQGRYKAVIVNTDPQLLHLTRYIHLNPKKLTRDLHNWYSSYSDYIGLTSTSWIKPSFVLKFFRQTQNQEIKSNQTYQSFVESTETMTSTIKELMLDES